ncbi:transcription factor BIM1 [Silene latifolia]|uniref:transcription factor BIM1 n=1 Tax=Silene latifolia TaxID=37657 RepID=UPI003D76D6A2
MELPQSRPFGTTQARKATHDFLSLNSHSSIRQDPRPSHGDSLKTHDFLQPLEGEQSSGAKEDNAVDINVKPQPVGPPASVVEHLLPGGIGTYSISRLPYITQKVPKPEENGLPVVSVTSSDRNDDNSNCSSYTGGSFMLWDESAAKKGNTGKENFGNVNLVKDSTKISHWPLDRPSQSSSNRRSSVSPLSSSQAPAQKNQSFMDMLKSAKGSHSMEEDEEEDLNVKKESSSSQRGDLRVKVDGKNSDQKANTPRSKHSATEQRRRCKINDRFQTLRELIPHSDQKRDKASFLLEVIEYIQFLQEKVNRYEGSYPGWNSEPAKSIQWSNNHGPCETFIDQPRVANGIANPVLMFGAKLDEKATIASLNIPRNDREQAEYSITNSIKFKTMDQQSGMAPKAMQADVHPSFRSSCAVAQPLTRTPDGGDAFLPQLELRQSGTSECEASTAGVKLKDQELAVEGGTINISSIYSQGLLNTLTRALQNSGVDLSQASISVQVDIGKRAKTKQNTSEPTPKIVEAPYSNPPLQRGRVENLSNESDHAVKRLKIG